MTINEAPMRVAIFRPNGSLGTIASTSVAINMSVTPPMARRTEIHGATINGEKDERYLKASNGLS